MLTVLQSIAPSIPVEIVVNEVIYQSLKVMITFISVSFIRAEFFQTCGVHMYKTMMYTAYELLTVDCMPLGCLLSNPIDE